jgi:GT2 family glycosyltransferase
MLDVSIIIVAWNVRQLLHDCLKSVYDQTEGIDFEVIYVDNASNDGSVEMVVEHFPKVKIIENRENEGFIKANNQGIEISEGRYILLLNSDTIVLDNAIAKIVDFADEHPEAGVIGGKVVNPDGTLQRSCFMYPSVLNTFLSSTYLSSMFPRSVFFGREYYTWWDYDDVREVETIGGCFSLVRATALQQVGLMDVTYFVYGDDPDWCFRFKKKGWKIMFTPDPRIVHYGGQTTKRMANKFLLQLFGSKLIFMKKHGNRSKFPLACFVTAMFFFLRVPYWIMTGILCQEKRAKSLLTARTYVAGGFYCLVNWRKLLMNKEVVRGVFSK